MTSQKEELTTDTSKLLILGSGSSARKELLCSVGLIPDRIEVPLVDESPKPSESARHYVRRVALLKAHAISLEKQSYLITADIGCFLYIQLAIVICLFVGIHI